MAEGTENNDTINDNNPATEQTPPIVDNNPGVNNEGQPAGNEPQQPSFEDQLKNWAKENGREINDPSDLLKTVEVEKEVVKEVNPWDDVIDDDDKAYLGFKKETGLGRKEFEALNKNWDEVSPLELARERIKKETGTNLPNEKADAFLESELGIEDINDLTSNDEIKLARYTKQLKDEYKAQQEKYRKPVENKQPDNANAGKKEFVELPNGAVMEKTAYENHVEYQRKFREQAAEAVKAVEPASFKVSVDDNGSVRDEVYTYEYSEQDVQNMASNVTNMDEVIAKRYQTEQGFNHKAFGEDFQWSDPKFREKAISDLVGKARAKAIEETMKLVGNHNYKPNDPLQKQTREGVKVVPVNEAFKFNR